MKLRQATQNLKKRKTETTREDIKERILRKPTPDEKQKGSPKSKTQQETAGDQRQVQV